MGDEGPKQGHPKDESKQGPPKQHQQGPPKQQKSKTAGDAQANSGVNVLDMIDLALCSPEVGAVNFNILRLVLRDLVKKSGFAQTPVKVNDLEAHQVENYKNYIQGAAVASPMPGVLRISPGGQGQPAGKSGPRTPKTGLPPPGGANVTPSGHQLTPSGTYVTDPNMDLMDKVNRMEKHLEALYQLPANSELIEKAKLGTSMSVNDMWQIIQLNNRIAAAEAAIQKMASLIEDLAKNMGRVKNDAKGLKKDAEGLNNTNSDLLIQGADLSDKYNRFVDVINGIKQEVNEMKKGWKMDRDNMEKTLGVDLGKIPTFMKPKEKRPADRTTDSAGGAAADEAPSEQFERGTQTFVKIEKDTRQPGGKKDDGQQRPAVPKQQDQRPKKPQAQFIPPEKISKMTAAEISNELTPEEIRTIPAEVYREMNPEQKKAIQDIRKIMKPQLQDSRKQPMGINKMTKEELSKLPPEQIAEQMPYEEAVNLINSVMENLTEDQKRSVKNIIENPPPPKKPTSRRELKKQEGGKQRPPPPPLGIMSMEKNEIKEIPAEQIANAMPYEEAASIPKEILEQMAPEQRAAVKKVLNQGPPPTPVAKGKKDQPPPQQMFGVASMSQEELQQVSPQEIASKMGYEEAKNTPQHVLEKMTTEQRAAIKKVVSAGPKKSGAGTKQPQIGFVSMTKEQLQEVAPEEIVAKMGHEEAQSIPQKVLEKMTDKQKEAVQKVIKKGSPMGGKPGVGVALMTKDELKDVPPEEIAKKMHYREAKDIPQKVLEKMTSEQKAMVKKIIDEGPPPDAEAEEVVVAGNDDFDDDLDDFFDDMSNAEGGDKRQSGGDGGSKRSSGFAPLNPEQIQEMSQLNPDQLRKSLTPAQAAGIKDEDIKGKFTPEQAKEIHKLKEVATGVNLEKAADMTPTELVNSLTPEQIQNMPEDQFEALAPAHQAALREARKSIENEFTDSGYPEEVGPSYTEAMEDLGDDTGSSHKKKSFKGKPIPKRERPGKHHHHKHHHKKGDDDDDDYGGKHTKVDVVQGPIPTVGEPLPPITLEQYLANLPPEEAANLAADAVQKELQKQYQQLQGMQRELAQNIQEKMEFIYQKLLREIVSQQLTTSPYMAVGGPEQCYGPGICTGHGMPAGIAVVQFPDAKDKSMVPGGTGEGGEVTVCPGPPICPGKDVCPYCRVGGGKDGLAALKGLEKKAGDGGIPSSGAPLAIGDPRAISELGESILQEMKSLMLLDLEKIRDEMRSKKLGTYDEQDILERLSAVWEALKILKHNEETIAVKIAKQDALFKKLPTKTIEKLSKIPDENLDAITTGNFNKPMYIPDDHAMKPNIHREAEEDFKLSMQPHMGGGGGSGGADKEDIQTLFNNLANVIAECTEQKDRIDQLADTARVLESGMVTKQMLLDSLSDKADKGLINTKVSYDEFGNTIDELHTQLHNLMVEGYQRNENWKKVTADLAEELAEKLDKVELAPIRAFFKSHLRNLEDKVKNLTQLIEEPDPAGTRKKLLKDYNCISCDRMVNIAGVTNGPTLPTIGPIKAGHSTASKRALDLHRMRMRKQFESTTKNLNALEKHGKRSDSQKISDPQQIANDIDVMHVVNRYTGGSHTAINNSSRISAQRGSKGGGAGNAIEELFDNTNRHRNSGIAQPPQGISTTGPANATEGDVKSGSFTNATQPQAVLSLGDGAGGGGGERVSVTGAAAQVKGSLGSVGARGSIGGGGERNSNGGVGERGSTGGGGERGSFTGGPPASGSQPLPPVTSSVGGGSGGGGAAAGSGSRSQHGSAEAVTT